MKKFLFLFFLFFNSQHIFSQINSNTDDVSRIRLTSYLPEQADGLSASTSSSILNKLSQIASQNGLGGGGGADRFLITANVVVQSKNITTTAPVMHTLVLEFTMFVGDGIDGTLFASLPIIVKGAGETEIKAYNAALKNIKYDDARIKEFLIGAKNKILDYYKANCDIMLKEVSALSASRNFDMAIYKLLTIPNVVKDCYENAMSKMVDVYRQKLELECQMSLSKAKSLIAQNKWEEAAGFLEFYTPDLTCYPDVLIVLKEINDHKCSIALGKAKAAWSSLNYDLASQNLSEIPIDSKCAEDADKLGKEILKYSKEVDKRDWDFKLKVQQDEVNITKARIQAAKEVGIAYGQNQPRVITYNIRGWYSY